MTAPLVSIIIPVYNGERFLSGALNSVFAQDYPTFEVIVVDDGSTDSSPEIAHSYPEVRYIHQANQGPGAARNAGIAIAHGEFVAFLDADDIWLSNKLSTQVCYLLTHPQIGYVTSRVHFILETGTEWPSQLDREYCQQDPPVFLPSALLVRKTILDQVGMFDPDLSPPNLSPAEDVDWFARANDLGVSMVVIDHVLLHKRIHDRNISVNSAENMQNLFIALRRSSARKRTLKNT